MRRKTFLLLSIAVLSCGLVTTGCESNDGPMEKMGESLDDATEDIKDAADDVKDSVKDATGN